MTNRHLQIFVKVVDCGKMSEAARDLGITQSSISQAISDIENEYNIKLFERYSRNLFLTPIGNEMLDYARHLLALQKQMDEHLKNASNTPHIRIGASATVGACVISNIVKKLSDIHPNAEPEIQVANSTIIEEMLVKSELDIGLVEGNITNPDLIIEPAIVDNLVIICGKGHKFWGRQSLKLDELSKEVFVFREKGSATRAQLEVPLIMNSIPHKVRWTSYYSDAIIEAVVDGYGISVISDLLVEKEVKEGTLWKCTVENLQMARSFDVVYHKNKYFHKLLADFKEICQNYKTNG